MFIEYIVVCNAHKFIDVENGPENKTVFKKVQFVIMQLDSLLSKDLLIGHCVYTITIEQSTSFPVLQSVIVSDKCQFSFSQWLIIYDFAIEHSELLRLGRESDNISII